MAENINDLFVSYKAVAPDTDSYGSYEPEDPFQDLYDEESVSRAESLAAAQAQDENSSETGEDEEEDEEEEKEEQGWIISNLGHDNAVGSYETESGDEGYYNSGQSGSNESGHNDDGHDHDELELHEDMQKFFEKIFKENGIHAHVTSFRRAPGQAGVAGNASKHTIGEAIDIVPDQGYSFDDLYAELTGSDRVKDLFSRFGLGVIDETDPKMKKKTHASGDHFHIGTDKSALSEWNGWMGGKKNYGNKSAQARKLTAGTQEFEDYRADWVKRTNNSYLNALKKKYGSRYSDIDYERIAAYMTAQSANETEWGTSDAAQLKNNNGGYLSGGKTMSFDSLDDFSGKHVNNLDSKWKGFMDAESLEDYIEKINSGEYRYFAEPGKTTQDYYNNINGCLPTVLKLLGKSMRLGGKFTSIRMLYLKKYA